MSFVVIIQLYYLEAPIISYMIESHRELVFCIIPLLSLVVIGFFKLNEQIYYLLSILI